jgi:hypothetical protein
LINHFELTSLKVLGLALTLAIFEVPAAAQTAAVGLSSVRAQRFGNEDLIGVYTPEDGDALGLVLAAGDFNGDGADDLASGMPLDDGLADEPLAHSGIVVVRYGIPNEGLSIRLASNVLQQTESLDPAEFNDLFGSSLAACDFNRDGFDDLAIGVPWEDYGGHDNAGVVQVHYGGSQGLPSAGDTLYAESTPGIPGDVERGDDFGRALACGDFDRDGFADLVIGVPGDGWGLALGSAMGKILILPGAVFGLDPARTTELDQDSAGMEGGAENGDAFGRSLAVGDFNGDEFDDLAVGVPGEDDQEGQLQVVFGGPAGLTAAGNLFWSESFLGGSSEHNDRFADSLTAGDFDGDGRDDLAIGVALDDAGSTDAGQTVVLYGAAGGFDRTRTQFWSEDTIFGAGLSEPGDSFGLALAAGDFDRDGTDDLAVSHPADYLTGPNDGVTTILMGSPSGLSAMRRRGIAAGFEGFPGDPNQHDRLFGYALASGDFDADGHADLAIGSPFEDENGISAAGAETVIYGSLFADGFETADTALWSQNLSSAVGNRLRVTPGAKLGPAASQVGLAVVISGRLPASATYVRVGPDRGFHDERSLKGTFFIDPQGLTMSPVDGANVFQMMAFSSDQKVGPNTRLAFDLVRLGQGNAYAIVANYFDEIQGGLRFAGSGLLTTVGDPNGHNLRIDYEWAAGGVGSPGHLTMWRTRYLGGNPDATGRVLLFSVDLPGAPKAVINNAFAGMITGQDAGTSGAFFLDEFTFRR